MFSFKRSAASAQPSLAASCLIASLFLCAFDSPVLGQTGVSISFNNTGLSSLVYNGTSFLSYGDLRLNQVTFLNSDSTTSNGNTSSTVVIDSMNQIQTRTYNWGRIAESYSIVGSTLKISVSVSNWSSLPIKGIWFEPLGLQFPSTIAEFAAMFPLMVNTLGQPAVQILTFNSGVVVLADEDNAKPLLLGFPKWVSSPNASVPLAVVTDRYDPCVCFPTVNRPIPSGATDTFAFSLRFGPTGSTAASLAGDVYRSFATAYPATLTWSDHRAIGSLHVSTTTAGFAGWNTNPRGYLDDKNVDITTSAGVANLQQRILAWADNDISILQNMNAQGMIEWDLEGQQFGPYNGDPTQLSILAPEMDAIADQFFQRFTDAGFRVGLTIRPQQLVIAPNLSSVQQNFLDDPTQLLLTKAKYAHDRWGATLFYVDSNVKSWTDGTPIDPLIFKTLQAALPDSIFFPEHAVTQYWAYSAPYLELAKNVTSTPDLARLIYPTAFSINYTADGHPENNVAKLVSAVQQGDILLYRSWYDEGTADQAIRSIYQTAGNTARSVTISISPVGPAVALGQSQQFTTTVLGSTNQQVSWTVAPAGAGTISPSGVYTAPITIASQQVVTIRALSAADSTKRATVTLTLTPPPGVTVAPLTASLTAGQTQQFTATVTGLPNQQVTWSVLSGGAGAISSSGLYTAPAVIPSLLTVTVQAKSAADPTKTATSSVTLKSPSCGLPGTNAFTGCYFGDTTLGTSSALAFSRVDPQINFDWSANGPGGGLGTTNYSVKWQGNFNFNAGPYTFTLSSDDGTRLYVDGHLVIDDWSTHPAYSITQSYTMTAGSHLIELDYFQAGGGASVNLGWTQPAACGTASTNAFTGCYFADTALGSTSGVTAFSRIDPAINFDWSATGPGGGLGTSNYSVKWQGNFSFSAGPYTFTLSTDDGSRLYVDGHLLIDDWSTHAPYSISQSYTMTPGTHLIELDYFQAGGGASANLSWAGSQQQVGISVNPSTVSLLAGQTQQFTAPVTGTTNQQVSWSVLSGGAGTITSAGLYTSPASVPSAQTVTVQATSAADPSKTATATITLNSSGVSCGGPSTNAFTGCYFGDTTLGSSAPLAFSRVDPQINFDWSANGPGGNLGTTNYSVKWQGNFTFNASPYTFTVSTDDGSRLYVDGHLIIDDWSTHAAYNIMQSYTMTAGTHLIELDYFQAGGGAAANLSWSQPASCGPASTNAFTGCYFADTTLGSTSGIAFSRIDPKINFNWSGGTPGGNLGGYNYSVKWQGNFTFNGGPYVFTLSTDDGSRLYVDGQLVIDDWSVHPAYPITQNYTLTAGTHLIEVDYFQAGGDAIANLSWMPSP